MLKIQGLVLLFLRRQDFLKAYLIDQVIPFQVDQMRSLFIVGQIRPDPLLHDQNERAVSSTRDERAYSKHPARMDYWD
jgi:hypothetical protein